MTEFTKQRWLDAGFDPITYDHREAVVERILSHNPESVLDVGCANGPDLYLLNLHKPGMNLIGLDKLSLEIEDARKKFELIPNTAFYVGTLEELLPTYPDKWVDVVFSNGVIMYSKPYYIKEMARIAKKAVILSERDLGQDMLHHMTDVLRLDVKVTKTTPELRPSWETDGYIYEITL